MSARPTAATPLTRTIVLWCPDWPVTAARHAQGLSPDVPLALTDKGLVFACSVAARREGVRRGLRLREAQYRCTDLVAVPYDPVLDARAFEPVITRIEEVVPGVQLIRPGTCAIRARGPSRYYGGETEAAAALIRCLADLDVPDVRVGIADGPCAAEQAARTAQRGVEGEEAGQGAAVRIVPQGESPRFLAPLPVRTVADERLATLLSRLGVHTLGQFAALPTVDVRRRFGAEGAEAHEKAGGLESDAVAARIPPRVFDVVIEFEPPLDRIDQVTFAIRSSVDTFIEGLTRARLVCTAIRVDVRTETGEGAERTWLHPRWLTAADIVDRVRWQLQGSGAIDAGLTSAIATVRISPERVDSTGHHEPGLWGAGPDERIHHGLTRVQGMLGQEGVLTAVIGGGRMLADRQLLVPWGDRPSGDGAILTRAQSQPWPGSLPGLAPATVFRERRPVALATAGGDGVDVDDRGRLTGAPELFSPTGEPVAGRPIEAWAGPWPVTERWWDPERARDLHRFQVVDDDGTAWLLVLEDHRWWAEARYD